MSSESLLEKARRRAAELGIEKNAVKDEKPDPAWDPDLIPDIGPARQRSPEDDEIDTLIGGLTIDEAYRRYIGKMEPKIGNKRESVMISCPMPGHPDKNPSAWMNLDENVWYCAACEQGGDVYDLAAIKHGYSLGTYKTDGSFPKLRADIAQDLGYMIRRTPGGQEYAVPTQPAPAAAPGPATTPIAQNPSSEHVPGVVQPNNPATSSTLQASAPHTPDDDSEDDEWYDSFSEVAIDWRTLVPTQTFLRAWMETTCEDDLPEEFYFWLGLVAIAAAVGDAVTIADHPPVKGNLFICLLGPTGMGKTRSASVLRSLLRDALPYDPEDPTSTGTYLVPTPGSGESLVDAFSKPIYDPADPSKIVGYAPVRGLLHFDELSSLVGRTTRSGSVMKPLLMELFDSYHPINLKTRGHGYVNAEGHYALAITTTQRKALRDILTRADTDSGFLNRWVFVGGKRKQLKAIRTGGISTAHLVTPLQELRIWSKLPGRTPMLEFEPDAAVVWTEFFDKMLAPMRLDEEQPILSRVDLQLKKLMLLFAVNEKSSTITKSIVERVIAIAPYLTKNYAGVALEMLDTEFDRTSKFIQRTIEKYEERKGQGPTAREIARNGNGIATDDINKAIKVLVEMGIIEEHVIRPERGRPTVRYINAPR